MEDLFHFFVCLWRMACLLCLLVKMWILVRLYREAKNCPRDSMNYQHNTSALAGLSTRKVAKECLLCYSPWCWIFFCSASYPVRWEIRDGPRAQYQVHHRLGSWQLVGWRCIFAPFAADFFGVHLFSKDVALSIFFDAEGQDFKRQILCW